MEAAAPLYRLVQNILGGVAHHKILLVDPQHPAGLIAVVRVEEQREIVENVVFVKGDALLHDGGVRNVRVEQVQTDGFVLVAGYVQVVHGGLEGEAPVGHRIGHVRFGEPAILRQPGVRKLLLQVVLKDLPEKAQVVIQADALAGQAQGCNGVQKAGGQPSQSAVAQRWLRLGRFDLHQRFPVLPQKCVHLVVEPQVDEVIGEQLADEKLGGDIVELLFAAMTAAAGQLLPGVGQQRLAELFIGALGTLLLEQFPNRRFQGFHCDFSFCRLFKTRIFRSGAVTGASSCRWQWPAAFRCPRLSVPPAGGSGCARP